MTPDDSLWLATEPYPEALKSSSDSQILLPQELA